MTPSELLSHAIEVRRRSRLASIRADWENRLAARRRDLAWYRHRLDELSSLLASAEVAELAGVVVDELTGEPARLQLGIAQAAAARGERRVAYAAARVRSLSTDLGPKLAECAQSERWIKCACEAGASRPIAKMCAQRAACRECRKRHAARARRRALPAIAGHMRAERDQRGRAGRVRMITLTVRHSGDVAVDRENLIRGWFGLRKQLHRWFGRALPFCLQFEVTAGARSDGHVHAHVIVVGGPPMWPYAAIQRTWRRVCPQSTHLDIQLARSAVGAAMYLAKYATKGADISGAWPDELVADVIAMQYGKRSITTSAGFWEPVEPICACCGERVQRALPPDPLASAIAAGLERIARERAP